MNEKTKTYSDGIREAWDAAYRISMMSNEQKYNVNECGGKTKLKDLRRRYMCNRVVR